MVERPRGQAIRAPRPLAAGSAVEVHSTFNDSWNAGFEVAEVLPTGYRIRRTNDRSFLPGLTGPADVRALPAAGEWGRVEAQP